MSPSTIAIIITFAAVIVFALDKVPLAVSAIFVACAFVLSGILSVNDAFAGFTSSVVLLLIGVMVIGQSLVSTGIAEKVGDITVRIAGNNEKRMAVLLYFIAAALSAFLPVAVIVAVFLPIIEGACMESDGKLHRSRLLFPMAIGGSMGGALSIIGATNVLNASAQLEASYYGKGFAFFDTLPAAGLSCLLVGLFYIVFGYNLSCKIFNFTETPIFSNETSDAEKHSCPKWKTIISGGTMIICAVLFILQVFNMGIVALVGACIVIATGCVPHKTAFHAVNWNIILAVVGTTALAKGINDSGAGQVIADTVLKISGPFGQSAFAMCVIFFILANILSNFMSDNAAVSITMPIALNVALAFDAALALPFAIACCVGSTLAIATPVGKTPLMMIAPAGYRFSDFFKMGGILNVIDIIGVIIALYLFYFM